MMQVATLNELGAQGRGVENSTLTDQAQREIADQMRWPGEAGLFCTGPPRGYSNPRTLHFLQRLKFSLFGH